MPLVPDYGAPAATAAGQAAKDTQVNVQRPTGTFLRVDPQHRPQTAPKEVPKAGSQGRSRGGDERQAFIGADEETDLQESA